MICLRLEIDPLSGDIVCASETEAAILHATMELDDVFFCHFLDRAYILLTDNSIIKGYKERCLSTGLRCGLKLVICT